MHTLADLKVPAGSVAIHWFEQSTFALKDAHGTIVQIDPYFPRNRPAERFIHAQPPLDEADLPTNYILLTHDHGDHTCVESIERIQQAYPQVRVIGPEESIDRVLSETKVKPQNTTTIMAGDSVEMDEMTAYVVYAKPPTGDPAAGIKPPDVTHLGYVIKTDGPTLYFSGDPIHTFPDHADLIKDILKRKPDIGFLTNHPTEGEFPFYAGSVEMARKLQLKHAAPSHYACFVKRDYNPQEWAAQFEPDGPPTLIIPRNSHIIYPQ